jgi:hypothetical protein
MNELLDLLWVRDRVVRRRWADDLDGNVPLLPACWTTVSQSRAW